MSLDGESRRRDGISLTEDDMGYFVGLPLCDLVDIMRVFGHEVELEIEEEELTLRENIQKEWNW